MGCARYFIVPSFPDAWTSVNRSYAAFVADTDMIYPAPESLAGPEHARDREQWLLTRDVQVRRNRRAFPRAWVVHDARLIRPSDEAIPARRDALVNRLRSADASRPAEPSTSGATLRTMAYIETDDPAALAPYLPGHDATRPVEEVAAVIEECATRVVVNVDLQRPGIVVLADVFPNAVGGSRSTAGRRRSSAPTS